MSAPVEHGLDCKCADCRLALVLFDALEASMRERDATPSYIFADVLAAAQAASTVGWRPPLPGSETEWGRRWADCGIVQKFRSREAAEEYDDVPAEHAFAGSRLVRRQLGPWIEVQS